MKCILALDQGTTSSRAILFDESGAMRGVAQKEFTQLYPQPGWVEHDPHEIWLTQRDVALAVLAQARCDPRDVAAIGITNQRETTVVWDRVTGEPVTRAIVWQDRRTAPLCDRLRAEGLEPSIQEKSGLVVDPYFSASKLRWILDHVPDARRRAEAGQLAFGTIDSWLVWNLTGGAKHLTDASNASRTMLLNLGTGAWDEELLRIFQIPRRLLPEVCGSSEVVAHAVGDFAGIPIAGIAGDQQAALFGQACHQPGMVKNTYGTGCFLLEHTGSRPMRSAHKLLSTIAWRLGDRLEYALEGSVFSGGATVQWLRDGLGLIKSSADVEALAASVPDAGGVSFVPAFAGLGAPYWDAYARGAVFGITRGTTAAHLARAALESIALQTADVLGAMRADSRLELREIRVDGGASVNNLLLQFQADILGVPVVRPTITETTALGAAYLAGLAVGVWKSPAEIAAHWSIDRRFEPRMKPDERHARLAQWAKAVDRAMEWEEAE